MSNNSYQTNFYSCLLNLHKNKHYSKCKHVFILQSCHASKNVKYLHLSLGVIYFLHC